MKHLVFAACAYEAAAGWSRRAPTLTALGAAHPVIAIAIVVAVAVHFALEVERLAAP